MTKIVCNMAIPALISFIMNHDMSFFFINLENKNPNKNLSFFITINVSIVSP